MGATRQHTTPSRVARWLATSTAMAFIGAACSNGGLDQTAAPATGFAPSTASSSATPTASSIPATTAPASDGSYNLRTSGLPRVEEGSCAAGVPTNDRVRCLTLVVPESRGVTATSTQRLVRLPVVIIAATDPIDQRQPDPVLWIDYDAGDGMLESRVKIFSEQQHSVNRTRDVITLDLRGSGSADPSLACSEVTELNTGAFAAEIDETSPEGRSMRLHAIQQCHDRLANDGVDLSAYASADAAQDLDDLRVALGVQQWNVVAGEYGSKLAQLLIRDHAASLRSVVVNATPIPLQADYFADLAPNAAQAWSALVATCQADTGCAEAFPDLASRLDTIVTDLAANPRRVDDVDLGDGRKAPFQFTASRMIEEIRLFRGTAEGVPKGLSAATALEPDFSTPFNPFLESTFDTYTLGSWGLWEIFPQDSNDDEGSFALGAHLSAVCRDEAPFTDPQRLTAAANTPLFGPLLGHHADLDACTIWNVPAAPSDANQAVHGDVPTLVLTGNLDTISSPAWADAFADGLTAAHIVHFTGMGTQPTTGGQSTGLTCARQLRDDFLANPTATLDDSCVATAHGPAFELA